MPKRNWAEGDISVAAYPITYIQGISITATEILKSDGIRTTVGLLLAAKTPKQRLKLAMLAGVPRKNVLDWATACDRMRVKGIGWDYSELLRIVGVRTASELRFRNPEKLAEAMREANNKRKLVSVLPSAKMVARWIEDAKVLPAVIRY